MSSPRACPVASNYSWVLLDREQDVASILWAIGFSLQGENVMVHRLACTSRSRIPEILVPLQT
jgi:hypothetical protein